MSAAVGTVHLPRWVYIALSALTATIGLAASGVTAKFFILGLERLEPDPTARSILVATGLLMIATELAAFGIASLLPANKLRSVRTKLIATGLLLLAFEAVTICVTQGALDQASESAMTASTQRIQELQATIQARRAAAQSLRANGNRQSASANGWTRTLGASALRDALKVEDQIDPLAHELAQLQAAARPTTASVLGAQGVMAYGLARGILISAMGLVMFGVAGALLREGMAINPVVPAEMPATAAQSVKLVQQNMQLGAARKDIAVPEQTASSISGYTLGCGKVWWRKMLGIPSKFLASVFILNTKSAHSLAR